jgi:hypothetical protein
MIILIPLFGLIKLPYINFKNKNINNFLFFQCNFITEKNRIKVLFNKYIDYSIINIFKIRM